MRILVIADGYNQDNAYQKVAKSIVLGKEELVIILKVKSMEPFLLPTTAILQTPIIKYYLMNTSRLIFFLFLQVFYACKNDVRTLYYLPENFEGAIAVVYLQKKENNQPIKLAREFVIPASGIVFTQSSFLDDKNQDFFLIRNQRGYDTLKYFLPEKPFVGKQLRPSSRYTYDTAVIAVNFRQLVNISFKIKGTEDYCNFKYELITIGRPNKLNTTVLKAFKTNLEAYLRDSICTIKQ